jgi:hypothetical protein
VRELITSVTARRTVLFCSVSYRVQKSVNNTDTFHFCDQVIQALERLPSLKAWHTGLSKNI